MYVCVCVCVRASVMCVCVCRHQDGGRGATRSVEGHQNRAICTMLARLRLADGTFCAQGTPRASVAVPRPHLCPFPGAVKLRTNEASRTRKVASHRKCQLSAAPPGLLCGSVVTRTGDQ